MKRNIFSVLLVCLMLVSVCVLSGCKVDDLEAQVNENASAAEGAVSDAINKAEDAVDAAAKQAAADLAAAKEELTKLIADGANADADALEAAVAEFNAALADVEAAIDAVEEAAKDNNDGLAEELAALKAELTTAITDASNAVAGVAAQELAAVKAELLAAISASQAASSADISAAVADAVEDLTALITTVQEANLAYSDTLKAELEANFAEALDEVANTAAAELAAATAKLEAAVALKADTTALEAAAKEYKELVDAAEAAAALADEALKAELVAKIDAADAKLEAAVKKVADDLTAATAKVEAAVALKADATALEAAVKEYKELVAAATAAATAADGALKTDLVAKIDAADAKLEAAVKKVADDLAASTTKLDAAIALKADATVLDATKKDLQDQIDYLEGVVGTLSGSTTDGLGDLKDYIDGKVTEALAAVKAAYIAVEAWNAATEEAVTATYKLAKFYGEFEATNKKFYYDAQWAEVEALYEAMKVRIFRAPTVDDVKALVDEKAAEGSFYSALDAIDTKADVIYKVLTAQGSTEAEVLYGDAKWIAALTEANTKLLAETDAEVKEALKEAQELYDKLAARYTFLEGKKAEADAINTAVEALIAAIKTNGYTAANKAEYEAIVKAIATWDEAVGAANAALINREKVATLDTDYAAAKAAYEKAAADMKALLESFTSYTYSAEAYKAVTDAKVAYDKWTADVAARGFEADKAVVDAYTAFAKVLARAEDLETAKTDADAIEALIKDLTTELENLTVVKGEYQTRYKAIELAVKSWKTTYFAAYPAEMVAGNANYDLLDHAAFDKLTALYNEKVKGIMDLAEALKAALAKIKTVTIYSGADIEAAKDAYLAFTNKLGDLDYSLTEIGLGTTSEITNEITTQTAAYKDLLAAADAAYTALTLKEKKDVTLNSATAIDALKAWYTTYAKVDLTKADSALVCEVDLGDNVLNADALAAAKTAVAAFAELTAAKKAEFDAVKAEIDALVAKNASTALRAAVDTALANYKAWAEGTKAPAGYTAAQFIPVDATALDAEKAKLDTFNAAVKALEDARDALIVRIKALALDYKTIVDSHATAQTTLDDLNDDITAFTASNDKVDCFADYAETLKAAQTAIDKAKALAEVKALYDDLKTDLTGVANAEVKKNMTDRADAVYAAAELAVDALDADAIALAKAKLELFDHTIVKYEAAIGTVGVDADKVYEAYELLAKRTEMTNASQLANEKTFVTATFAAVLP